MHKSNIFIKKANIVHGEKYSYELVKYVKALDYVIISCKKHGNFNQTPNKHLLGRGCPICAKESRWVKYDDIILRFKKIHHEKYEYNESTYCGSVNKMSIFCKNHKIWFMQSPHSHLKGYGCPSCSNSIGENKIRNWLSNKDIEFDVNKTFIKCKNIRTLPFDFYLPKENILIEFDGEQHYKPKNFGGISKEKAFKKFKNQIIRDKIKNDFAKNQKIKLIRISYLENPLKILNENIL